MLLLIGGMDTRNMQSNFTVNKYLHTLTSCWILLIYKFIFVESLYMKTVPLNFDCYVHCLDEHIVLCTVCSSRQFMFKSHIYVVYIKLVIQTASSASHIITYIDTTSLNPTRHIITYSQVYHYTYVQFTHQQMHFFIL